MNEDLENELWDDALSKETKEDAIVPCLAYHPFMRYSIGYSVVCHRPLNHEGNHSDTFYDELIKQEKTTTWA